MARPSVSRAHQVLPTSRNHSPTPSHEEGWSRRRPSSAVVRTTSRSSTRGVPSGGLFSGAEVPKTEEQEEIYGGVAGLAYDPSYHQPCDTYFNISDIALDQFSDAMAQVIERYGRTTAGLEEDEEAGAQTLGRKAARSMTFQGPRAAR
jgi:hypothetical protein